MIPKVVFRYSWVYDEHFKDYFGKIDRKSNEKYPSQKEVSNYTKQIKDLWEKEGEKILKEIKKVSGLNWKDKSLRVYIVGKVRKNLSDPLTIGMYKDKTLFIDILTHELIHVIQSQKTEENKRNWKIWEEYCRKIYNKEEPLTLMHIFLHAVHKEVYIKLFGRKRLERDIRNMEKYPAYKRSWDIIERDGHKNILKQFKKSES